MEYINVMPVVTVLSSGCSSYYQVSLSLLSIKGGADQGFSRLARASGISLEKALLSHSDPRAPPARPFACVPFACWGLARPVCQIVSLLIASGSIEISHL